MIAPHKSSLLKLWHLRDRALLPPPNSRTSSHHPSPQRHHILFNALALALLQPLPLQHLRLALQALPVPQRRQPFQLFRSISQSPSKQTRRRLTLFRSIPKLQSCQMASRSQMSLRLLMLRVRTLRNQANLPVRQHPQAGQIFSPGTPLRRGLLGNTVLPWTR
jgi:hypothetical protein